MNISAQKKYDFTQSPFYKLGNKKKLAELLNLPSHDALKAIVRLKTPYKKFEVKSKNKMRPVQMPSRELYPIHNRIFLLLRRMELPDYLHSGVKGRSYITNAKAHLGTKKTYTVDIKLFYPSVTRSKVAKFFRDSMKCSEDVVAILANITTCDDHIPTGSSLSQILAYLACKDMFDELYAASLKANLVMTCYVDDLTFSGDSVTRKWIYDTVKPIIAKHGLKSHKDKYYKIGQPKEITGVIVDGNTINVCNRLHKSIYDLFLEIADTDDLLTVNKLYDSLIGKLSSAGQIDDTFKAKRTRVNKQRKSIKAEQNAGLSKLVQEG